MEQRHSPHTARRRLLGGGLLAGILLTATAAALQWQQPAEPAARTPAAPMSRENHSMAVAEPTPSALSGSDRDRPASQPSALADQLVGVWQLQKHGQRTLQLNRDGTATAEVKLNMLGALIYGEQMTLELDWSLKGDVMTQTVTSGSPPHAVERLINDWGNRREYRVIEVSDQQLVLAEVGDDGDRDVWTSIPKAPSSTASRTPQSPR